MKNWGGDNILQWKFKLLEADWHDKDGTLAFRATGLWQGQSPSLGFIARGG